MTNASRAPVDLDALARDLKQSGGAKGDPLAELARIVGQDDPFRALLAAHESRNEPRQDARIQDSRIQDSRIEARAPSAPAPRAAYGAQASARIEPAFAPESPARATPADAFDQYLASVEHDLQAEPAYDEAGADPAYDERSLRRAKPRRRLVAVGAGLGVLVVCVTGALTYKGLHRGGSGGVPLVQADTAPLKVAPKVADGVQIPDQNRQIYDGKPRDAAIRIVNREEQPLDVAQAARAQGAPASGVTPGGAPLDAFGEPRRVRTVAVKPDTPAPAPQRETSVEPVVPAAMPTMTLPGETSAPRSRSIRQASATPQAIPAQANPVQVNPAQVNPSQASPAPASPSQPARPETTAATPPAAERAAPAKSKVTQRVAAVAPDAAPPVETTAATETDAAAVGGFSVQLGVRGSAAEARTALREMQGKYAQLAGKPELIRQAEVNGKTIFRVRVGPLERAEATSLCGALKGAGGQCFVAKN